MLACCSGVQYGPTFIVLGRYGLFRFDLDLGIYVLKIMERVNGDAMPGWVRCHVVGDYCCQTARTFRWKMNEKAFMTSPAVHSTFEIFDDVI